jgi:XTP/dITP diphosphohydrolase
MRVLAATRNPGKLRELRRVLAPLDVEVAGLDEVAVEGEPVEDGADFLDNAKLKAAYYASRAAMPAIADDSGLCVDALDGRPGVHSARYSGPDADAARNSARLLAEMDGVADRRARFVCVVVCAKPTGEWIDARGECVGEILRAPRGASGFGYDPLFYSRELGCSFAEAALDAKNGVSHRGRALRRLMEMLPEFLRAAK